MSKLLNLVGQRFGFWVVKCRAKNAKNGKTQWLCVCECGQEKIVTANSLRTGNSTSCGCNHAPNLVNLKFGNIKVLRINPFKTKLSKRYWECQCSCGKIITTTTYKLKNNLITSCGCKLSTKKQKDEYYFNMFKHNEIITGLIEEIEESIFLLKKGHLTLSKSQSICLQEC